MWITKFVFFVIVCLIPLMTWSQPYKREIGRRRESHNFFETFQSMHEAFRIEWQNLPAHIGSSSCLWSCWTRFRIYDKVASSTGISVLRSEAGQCLWSNHVSFSNIIYTRLSSSRQDFSAMKLFWPVLKYQTKGGVCLTLWIDPTFLACQAQNASQHHNYGRTSRQKHYRKRFKSLFDGNILIQKVKLTCFATFYASLKVLKVSFGQMATC